MPSRAPERLRRTGRRRPFGSPTAVVVCVTLLVPVGVEARSGHFWFQRGATPGPSPSPVPPRPTATPTPPPSCRVDVLTREPAIPFDLLGLVEVQSRFPEPDDEEILDSARRRACELGGDALVILYRRKGRQAGLPAEGRRGRMLPDPRLRAAVLRYRESERFTVPSSP